MTKKKDDGEIVFTFHTQGLWEHHLERVKEIKVSNRGSFVFIRGKDLRELLFEMDNDLIPVGTDFAYKILNRKGVVLQGFIPSAPRMRKMGFTMEFINKVLPNFFKSVGDE